MQLQKCFCATFVFKFGSRFGSCSTFFYFRCTCSYKRDEMKVVTELFFHIGHHISYCAYLYLDMMAYLFVFSLAQLLVECWDVGVEFLKWRQIKVNLQGRIKWLEKSCISHQRRLKGPIRTFWQKKDQRWMVRNKTYYVHLENKWN